MTRDDVRRALWTEDTFVEFETAIAVAISKIRQALGDSATNPRFVETIPKHGYRFWPMCIGAPLVARDAVGAGRTGLAGTFMVPRSLPRRWTLPARSWRRRPVARALLGVVVIAVAALYYLARAGPFDSRTPRQPASLTVMPFRIHASGLSENLGTEVAGAITTRLRGLSDVRVKPWIGTTSLRLRS